ncbi:MAG TPA: hypothetical protein VMZ91_00880 [Candidatus Paceibacterota bacterium]|nr:hypothetical protein [Candidatus Paceibacterota bacterium]
MKNKKAQIWVETAIYSLIGLAIIGIILAIANPSISRYKDEIIIEQTIAALNDLNGKVLEVRETAGNIRIVEFRVKKGSLIIDCQEDKILYLLEESGLEYSEPGAEIQQGDIKIKTEKNNKKYDISLVLEYKDENIDLTYNEGNEKKTFSQASVAYKFSIENLGNEGEKTKIDIMEIS